MSKKSYIYYIALALGLAVSCQREVSLEEEYSRDLQITFSPAIYVPQTRATFGDGEFYVNAWTVGNIAGGRRYMNNVEVTKSGDVWKPETTYYWPKTDSLFFVATHGVLWAAISDKCDSLKTNGTVTFRPVQASGDDGTAAQLLYSDKSDVCTWKSGSVPIQFHNALASVTAKIIVNRFDDASRKNSDGMYWDYKTYDDDETSGKTPYYVVRYGLNPNAGTYPSKVYLKDTVMTHIWRVEVVRIMTRNVANKGSLKMRMGDDGKWSLPENSIWTTPADLESYKDSVSLFDTAAVHHQVPVPANLVGFDCDFGTEYYVMPQNLKWSITSAYNQRSDVIFYVEDYMADNNKDGVFDYRDVYKYYVANNDLKDTVLVYKTSVLDSLKKACSSDYENYTFCKWYEWNGGASTTILRQLHEAVKPAVNLSYCEVLDSLPTAYLTYFVKKTINLSSLHEANGVDPYWKMNTKTTYNIALDPVTTKISFEPSVAAWYGDAGKINVE